MPDIQSKGIFADTKSGGGLYRGLNQPSGTEKVTGAPIGDIAKREFTSRFTDFTVATDFSEMVSSDVGTVTPETIVFGANGGRTLLMTHDTANEGFNVQQALWGFKAVAGRVITFEARISNADWTESDWFIGFGEVDTTFMLASGVLAVNGADNFVGFHSLDTSAVVNLSSAGIALANRQDTVLGEGVGHNGLTIATDALTDAAFHTFGIRVEGTTGIEFYLDGRLVHVRTSDDAFAEIMVPTFTMLAGGAENAFNIDWFNMGATR